MDPKDDMPEIKTGNGIDRDLAATTNDRLKKSVWEIRILNATMGEVVRQQRESIKAEDRTKQALDILTDTIKELDRKNGRLQVILGILAFVTLLLTGVQVWIAIHPAH